MSFFYLSTENETLNTNGTMEMGGGEIEPIPAKTQVLASLDEIKWDSYGGEDYISARWVVLQPSEYKNRRIFQKIKLEDSDPKKRDKAMKMFAAIDHNAKGGIVAKGERPTDNVMQGKLLNKPMVLMLQVWSIQDEATGETKKGNWISAVSPRNSQKEEKAIPVVMETKEMSDEEQADLLF